MSNRMQLNFLMKLLIVAEIVRRACVEQRDSFIGRYPKMPRGGLGK
jgi:hypothetical protein